jgi:hypothetical protein
VGVFRPGVVAGCNSSRTQNRVNREPADRSAALPLVGVGAGRWWAAAAAVGCRPLALLVLGADSRFFALLGSAPQELNTVRPEAKLTC